jgi:HD-GYP domain-containing protein (c-di-GMP phosphodiesterase class II)
VKADNGLLHDLGLYLPLDGHRIDAVDPERIRTHPLTGARWLRAVAGLKEVAAVLEAHHERIDGTGYPHGLRGDEIPQSARIIAIAEVYDVLTAPGSYRSGHSHERGAEELRKATDRQLDARLVELFLTAIPEPAARPSLDHELIAARHMAARVHARATTI